MSLSESPALAHVGPRRLKLFLILTAVTGAGVFFLARAGIDWQWTKSLMEEAGKVPAKQASLPSPSPAPASAPSFDVLSADEAGMVIAAGKGPEGAAILLRSGSQTLGETKADENGEWVLMLEKPLAPGDYVLSLQAIDPATHQIIEGRRTLALKIVPHVKTMQTHLEAGTPPAADKLASHMTGGGSNTVVRPGDTLWDIARRQYGDGKRYPDIVDANKPQIKNPDLIFPNQQFEIPHK